MSAGEFRLLPFQEVAAQKLRDAALKWLAYGAKNGPIKFGTTRIPFLGQLKAVTGAGKTPVLASTIGGLGDSVVIWTTRSSAVVDQTFDNLNGKYRSLLPPETQVLREVRNQNRWRDLIDSKKGLTILLMTVASWNEAEAESKDAGDVRLRLRREQPDWAGVGSPWEQLSQDLVRPLWIVSDESHNQSSVQLDQLAALGPEGFFMASATPIVNELFSKWTEALELDRETHELLEAGHVPIATREVVDANLLKTTIEVIDFRSGTDESLEGALVALDAVEKAADKEGAAVTPRAIYVVEKSNPGRGSTEEARPTAIWRYLRSRGVPKEQIAVYTDTKELPEDAERVSSLSELAPRYRHIIFNQSLQEGWDDPEAYVCYFDGATKSFVRIRQIVGRVLRQPSAMRYKAEELNTATLILETPATSYDNVIAELKAELRLYAPEDQPDFAPVKVKTRKDPLPAIPVKKSAKDKFRLPSYVLKAPSMTTVEKKLATTAARPWPVDALEAGGFGRKAKVSVKDGSEEASFMEVLRSARTQNGGFLRRRILQRNRACVNAIHPDLFSGPAFEQWSCFGSQTQEDLTNLAGEIVDYFEERVSYQEDPDPVRGEWAVGDYRPRDTELEEFTKSLHPHYSVKDLNNDERDFARAVDRIKGVRWARNPSTANLGYGIPLPTKVGDSSTFYPDFLVWIDNDCWAIDTTGRHLLDEKVRGKLIALGVPRLALAVRGQVDLASSSRESKDGWSLVIARPNLKPVIEHAEELDPLLSHLSNY